MHFADVLGAEDQAVSGSRSGCGTHKTKDAKLQVGHSVGKDINLHTKSHKIDLLECADGQGINQMGAFMDQIIGKNCQEQSDILPGTFIHGLNSSKYR